MFCNLQDLRTESDVEQKLLWRLLVADYPAGLGLSSSDVFTKSSLRRLEIGKGDARHLYYPDYVVVLAGLPLLVIEAKKPGADLDRALDEARLYAGELNALFPPTINPCGIVVACNGNELVLGTSDHAERLLTIPFGNIHTADALYGQFVEQCKRSELQKKADQFRGTLKKPAWKRAVNLLGGQSTRNQELAPNTFGATIAGDYGRIFNPTTWEDRAYVVRKAYIPSLSRERYIEPIDRVIRSAIPPASAAVPTLANTAKPTELTRALIQRKSLQSQTMLLVGSVGAGKSTFVDFLMEVALPQPLLDKMVWVRLNLNDAPVTSDLAYKWIAEGLANAFESARSDLDFERIDVLMTVFHPDIAALKKGALSMLPEESLEYKKQLADFVMRLQADEVKTAKAMSRMICGDTGRLLVVVLDNCDKRDRDTQLLMFQVSQWVRDQFKCLVILPIRDVTYDMYKNQPPLDTALKGLAFRIEPPLFSEVLQRRVALALSEMKQGASRGDQLSYTVPNGMKVTYPVSNQGMYLASILRSLYAHDKFIRQVMAGLAGRDVRRALQIFMEFCSSGHIGEDELYKIFALEGDYVLPLAVVARVILRMNRRYYDGNESYVKNVFQAYPEDALPDHFVRIDILTWLSDRKTDKGPSGAPGFFRVSDVLQAMASIGHDTKRTREEVGYLVRERCIIAEHLRLDTVEDTDLISLAAPGVVHLQLLINPEYLAACAEDTWVNDSELAERISSRITQSGPKGEYAKLTVIQNCSDYVTYLEREQRTTPAVPANVLADRAVFSRTWDRELHSALEAIRRDVSRRLFVGNISFQETSESLLEGLRESGLQALEAIVPVDKKTGRNRGFGFVRFATAEHALGAIEKSGLLHVHGRDLRFEESADDERTKGARDRDVPVVPGRVFVGNLAYITTEPSLRQHFADLSITTLDVQILRDKDTGSRGYGFVTVGTDHDIDTVIKAANGTTLDNRRLRVAPAARRTEAQDESASI